MREINFRGYNKGIKKWIYGCLVKCWSKEKEDFIDDKLMIVSRNNNTYYEIDKDSIGQYTGFKDRTGKEIYEGDIIKNEFKTYEVGFNQGLGMWEVVDVYNENHRDIITGILLQTDPNGYEVIDNVYEKQLKGGNK